MMLFTARTVHARLTPFRHRFAYRLWMLLADIDAPPPRGLLFRTRMLSLSPRDHGPRDGSALRAWVEAQLIAAGIAHHAARIDLLAMPRILGWAFNPISLFLCRDAHGTPFAVLYETKNTFGDQHAYVAKLDGRGTHTHQARKRLHVSPFFDMQGGYRFALSLDEQRLSLLIRLEAADGPRLVATLSGRFAPATTPALARALATMPFVTLKVFAMIHVQALRLWWRGARFHRAPAPPAAPSSAATAA
jgi:hypothetical protein